MFCIQCGNKIPDESIFCNACGSPTKPANQSTHPTTGPTQSSRTTVQFDNNGQVIPPQMNSFPQAPVAQFRAAQPGSNPSNPNNPQYPPTQIAPTQFSSNPHNPQYPPHQFSSNPNNLQVPPTQVAPTLFSSNPSNPQYRPLQTGQNQFSSQPPPAQLNSNPNNPLVPPTQVAPTQLSSNPNNTPYPPVYTGQNPYGGIPGNAQGPSTPYGERSPYESTQYSSDPSSQPWQGSLPPAVPAAPPPPPAGLQQWLMRTVGPNLASNAIFGVSLGGVLAAVIGALASIIFISIAHAIAPHVPLNNGSYTGEDIVDIALGMYPLHNVFRDAMQLFLLANGVGLHIQNSSDATTYTAPLNGLFIIPAIVLTFGGYIAAGTDVKNQVQSSLLRGAAIAIPYTILLFLMTTQANGCIPNGNTTICSTVSSSNSQLTMDTTSLLLFGVLWGALFGLLGASIKLARGQWRHTLYQYLRSNSRPQVVGAITGSLVAVAIGSMLSLIVVASFVAYTSYSSTLFSHLGTLNNILNGDWASLTLLTIAQGPLYALNLFFFSMNAPVGLNSTTTDTTGSHIAISLFGSTPQISPWFHLLLAIPVICLFLGGRVSASLGRVQPTTGAGAIQGALIAIPFTVLVMLLTVLSTITFSDVSTSSSTGSQFADSASAGVGAFDLFLWALLAGAVLGALGGMYQTSSLKVTMSRNLASLAALPRSLSKPGYAVFARLSKQPNALQRTSTKDWLFTTVFCSLILLIGAAVFGGILLGLNQTLTREQNVRIRDIASVVLVAVPGILILYTCAAALLRDPVPVGGTQSSITTMPVVPPASHVQQYQQYPQQPQQLQQPQYEQYPPQPPYPQYQQYPPQPPQPQF